MNLQEIRELFVSSSGRYDLQTEGKVDFFINSGQRALDRLASSLGYKTPAKARFLSSVDSGEWFVSVPGARVVEDVWLGEEGQRQALRFATKEMAQRYTLAKAPFGRPSYVILVATRVVPDVQKLKVSDLRTGLGYIGSLIVKEERGYTGLILYPVPNKLYHIEVAGVFYSNDLVEPLDTSYWSETHPELLYQAIMWQVEVFQRNTEGARDWSTSLANQLSVMGGDEVEQEMREIYQ